MTEELVSQIAQLRAALAGKLGKTKPVEPQTSAKLLHNHDYWLLF
jgi:hypothetical protein